MSRELLVQAPNGSAHISVLVPDGWAGPDDTAELAVLFPEDREGIVDFFATNTVVRFVPADAPSDPFSAGHCIIAESGRFADESGERREVLSTAYVGEVAVMQIMTTLDDADTRTQVVTSVASHAWDRFDRDIAEIHASVRLTRRGVQ